jgi:tRNA(Ile)-lysidine synthase
MSVPRPLPKLGTLTLPVPGILEGLEGGRKLSAHPAPRVDPIASDRRDLQGPLTAFVRGLKAGEHFLVRGPRRGDRYRPLGLKGSSKLSDLFINAKIPRSQRERWPVVVRDDEIVWVPGFRVAESWKVEKGDPILCLCWQV